MNTNDIHPTGTFDAVVIDHGYSPSKTGTDMLVIDFETPHGEIRAWLAFSPKAVKHSIKKVRAIGYQGNDLADLWDGNALKNHMCSITVNHEEYDGKVTAKVGWINPHGYSPEIEHDKKVAANVRRFNALLAKEPVVDPVLASVDRASTSNMRQEQNDDEPPPIDDSQIAAYEVEPQDDYPF